MDNGIILSQMSIQTILKEPDNRLRQISSPVPDAASFLPDLIQDMKDTLAASGGIGLAAPQIGELWRVVVIDLSLGKSPPVVLVNPVLSAGKGSVSIEEGCLSVDGRRVSVPRHSQIHVKALDEKGRKLSFLAKGLLSICVQHEVDHLNGRLIIDAVQPA